MQQSTVVPIWSASSSPAARIAPSPTRYLAASPCAILFLTSTRSRAQDGKTAIDIVCSITSDKSEKAEIEAMLRAPEHENESDDVDM